MAENNTESRLESSLRSGRFTVTAELGPPKGCDAGEVKRKAECLKDAAQAVNITDNQTGVVRMSSIAASSILIGMGIEPVMQMVTRDRNRIALQSDILGAAALGIRNILCLSGDHQSFGNQPGARGVFDIDSIQLISAVKNMRDNGVLIGGSEKISGSVNMFIGAAASPFSPPLEYRPYRLKKKIEAGADFIQTQAVYDTAAFSEYMKRVVDMGLHEKAYILAGVVPLKSHTMLNYMAANVPGISIPGELEKRMRGHRGERACSEGIDICCEIIDAVKNIEGVSGIHLCAIGWEERVAGIVQKAGL